MKRCGQIAVGLLVIALVASSGHTAEIIWASAGGGNWDTTGNWVDGVVPTSADTVSFRGWAPLSKSTWTVTASIGANASNMKDNRRSTAWTGGANQASGQWIKIDLGSVQTFGGIKMESTISTDYARGFDVYVSSDGNTWGSPIASGTGSSADVDSSFASQTYQWIKIQLNTAQANWWQVAELTVWGTGGSTQFATGSMTASASASAGGAASNVLDFNNGTVWSPGVNQANGQWIQLDLGADRTFDAISMDAYSRTGDYPNAYKVEVAASATPSTWTQVATGSQAIEFNYITFSSQTKRYIKITQTGSAGNWWSIYELRVYGTPTTCTTTGSETLAGIKHTNAVTFAQASGHSLTVTGDWTQTAGTFTGGNSPIDLGGNLNLSGGAFTSTSSRLDVGGAFSKTGGTFTHNSGQVILSATSSKTFATDGATFYDVNINDGLVTYFPFDDSASPATDSSGYARTATWAGSTTSSTSVLPNAPALNFTNTRSLSVPGNNSYASFTAPDVDAITIAAWVRSTSTGDSTYPRIVEMPGYALSFSRANPAGENPNSVSWTIYTNLNDYSWRTPTGSIADGVWYHIAATFNGSSAATVYINGVAQTLSAYGPSGSGANFSNVGTGYVGNIGAAVNRDWNGYFDDFRIYNRVLSAPEIADLASGGTSRTSPVGTQTLNDPLIVANNLKIASGTLDVSASGCASSLPCDVTVGANWYNYGGAFTPRTGIVTFNGTGSTSVIRSDRVPFNAVTISNTGTWTLQDRLFVDGTLTINAAGTLAQSSSNYDIHAGTLNKTAGTISGSGDVVLDAVSDQSLVVDSLSPTLRIESPRESGLIGHWKLDEGRGTTAYDLSGNGYNATIYNSGLWSTSTPSSMPIDDAGSLALNGSSQYARVSRTSTLEPTAVTVAAWVKRVGTQVLHAKVVNKTYNNSGSAPYQSYSIQMSNDADSSKIRWELGLVGGGTSGLGSNTLALPDGVWTHVVGVYDPAGSAPQQRLYINGALQTSGTQTTALAYDTSANGDVYIGQNGGSNQYFAGSVDDVRIYNRGLSDNEVKALYDNGYSTGSTTVYSLGATATMGGALTIDSGILDANTFRNTITGATTISGGEYKISSNTNGQTFTGGLTVNRYGDLTLASANGKVIMGNGSTLVMNGTLTASSTTASIQAVTSGRYTFSIGTATTPTATPTLNITGLQVKDTTANGMYVNPDTESVTTFTRFDNIAFSNGNGTGAFNFNLRIFAKSLNLTANGCTFDAGVAKTVEKNVYLAGDSNAGNGETRAVFGGSTCASSTTCEAYDGDDDNEATPDGVNDGGNGAVIQWLQAAYADTTGSIEGFPTTAFDWSTFSYYATYVAFHDTSGTIDTIYVRNAAGTALYSWNSGSNEQIVGTPRWDSEGAAGSRKHYLYVAVTTATGGKVYRLYDNGSTLVPDAASPWSGNPYTCTGCTMTTPLAQDSSNVYWGGVLSSAQKLWTLSKSTAALVGISPINTTNTNNKTAPSLWVSTNTYLYLGLTGSISKFNISGQALVAHNTNPVGYAVTGRITILGNKLYAGDDNGTMWCLDPDTNFATPATNKFWSYKDSNHAAGAPAAPIKSHYFDFTTSRVYFGDQDGHLYTINSSGSAVLAPWRPGTSSDAFQSAPLYQSGILVAGTTTGTLWILDANSNNTVPAKIQTYQFGSSTQISGIAYDQITSRYIVSTANATTKDGKLYYFAAVTDPTTSFP